MHMAATPISTIVPSQDLAGVELSILTHGHYWRLPAPCRSTAIVLSLQLTVEELASLTHGGSYRGCHPIEAYNRHCNFPIALQGLQGLPPLTLHSDTGKEVPLNEEPKIDSN